MIDHPDIITATDIVAVNLLNVAIPPRRIVDLLEGTLGQELRGLLAAVPSDVDIGSTDAKASLEPDSSADQAWRLLRDREEPTPAARPGLRQANCSLASALA